MTGCRQPAWLSCVICDWGLSVQDCKNARTFVMTPLVGKVNDLILEKQTSKIITHKDSNISVKNNLEPSVPGSKKNNTVWC